MRIVPLVVFLFISASAFSEVPPKAPDVKSEQQAEGGVKRENNSNDQQKPSAPAIAIIPNTDAEAAENKSDHKAHNGSQEGAEFWIAKGYSLKVTDTLLVLFTFLLFLATVALWWSTRRLVKGADETAKTQLRPYVFVQNVESFCTAEKATESIVKWTFFPVWKNSGNTWTQDMVSNVNSWIGVGAGALPANFDFPDYGGASRNMIGPNATMHGAHIDLTIEQLMNIRSGTAHAYIWGWAEYNDVFKGTKRHRSEFCFEILVKGNPTFKEGGFAFALHGPFNGYDKDCYRQPQKKN